jgi:Family of unknown function (DUF6328)
MARDGTDKIETEPLDKELQHTLEEARTVIPGLQALFGFQLIVPFHPSFKELEVSLKQAHLGALVCLALAIALIMTPAAYHRMVLRGKVSRSLIDFASRLIACAMAAFTLAIALNMFLIGSVVLESEAGGTALGLMAFLVVAGLWFGYPMMCRKREK